MSKRRTARSSLIPYPVIAAAVRGDPEAVNRVLDHYSGYIAALSMRRGCNQNGNPCFAVDEEIRRRIGRVDKVIYILVWANKKDAMRRHSAYFIILFRFMAAADKRQWSSAASMPRRKTRVKLCPRFCAANVPSHQICRSFSASRYSGL